MGMIGSVLGIGRSAGQIGEAVGSVAEVFVGNRADRDEHSHEKHMGTLDQFTAEFEGERTGQFDGFVNGLNRLPRPMLALGTIGLFVYSMAEPTGFALRMQGLAIVPDPLWWLLGAIVSFYFGARELHHFRSGIATTAVQAVTRRAVQTAAPAAGKQVGRSSEPTPKQKHAPATAKPEKTAKQAEPIKIQPVAVRAEDPHFNAAIEEWRRKSSG